MVLTIRGDANSLPMDISLGGVGEKRYVTASVTPSWRAARTHLQSATGLSMRAKRMWILLDGAFDYRDNDGREEGPASALRCRPRALELHGLIYSRRTSFIRVW